MRMINSTQIDTKNMCACKYDIMSTLFRSTLMIQSILSSTLSSIHEYHFSPRRFMRDAHCYMFAATAQAYLILCSNGISVCSVWRIQGWRWSLANLVLSRLHQVQRFTASSALSSMEALSRADLRPTYSLVLSMQ